MVHRLQLMTTDILHTLPHNNAVAIHPLILAVCTFASPAFTCQRLCHCTEVLTTVHLQRQTLGLTGVLVTASPLHQELDNTRFFLSRSVSLSLCPPVHNARSIKISSPRVTVWRYAALLEVGRVGQVEQDLAHCAGRLHVR